MAQANSASAIANTSAPSQPAGSPAGRKGKGRSQLSASPAMTAIPHASGGRIMTCAVSVVSSMAGPIPAAHVMRNGLTAAKLFPKLKLNIAGHSENGSDNGIRRDRDEVRHKI